MSTALLNASGLHKSYAETPVLHGVDLRVDDGEFVAVMGPSGSGKSTLLHCIAGLDELDAGAVWLDETDLTELARDQLADARRERMGFVFQQPTLLRDLSLLDNIVLTSSLDGIGTSRQRRERAEALLSRAGIGDLGARMPTEVSGGELQRAGICRAMMRSPRILFCDEPTGALNSTAATAVLDLLVELNSEGTALLVVTHDATVAARADRVVFMIDGRVAQQLWLGETRDPVAAVAATMRHVGV
ncbi:ABC transporter ATP-binding protein [Tessaracoccus rhinocerotis]|uniref:ABC transporter ATP-binding protein n=1 Tax=Tessaracoccus rhinocerotis TaxID=1689449 RepID=A0A553K5N3_9ACTN|nr:ABC transporter ATP-binding protein [Tessaracoccus rhinocerotis]TRY20016.1 ABC transporter ATP-binding protein [Tessaracoccus rhinocerotis]